MKEYKNILIIKLSAFGDFLFALGDMKYIRERYPNARITLLTTKPFKEMAKKTGYFDRIIIDDRVKKKDINKKNLKKIFEFYKRLRYRFKSIDLVADMQCNDRMKFYYWLLFPLKKPDWCRFTKMKFRIFNVYPKRKLLPNKEKPNLDWLNEDINKFNLPEKYVLIVAGCSAHRPLKRWSSLSYARLANMLYAKHGYTPVLIGTKAEKKENSEIMNHCSMAIDLTSKTNIFELGEICKKASLCVSNDTGPAIMSGVANCPTLVLYASTESNEASLPPGDKVDFMKVEHLKDLTPEDVYKKLNKIKFIK
ncbi:MAG: glycosyltransferase family 9 protein [Alphaproteobacteria bacterium]|nr:glycosyltransferase family 9 protein [Alphaproteobacteria bacterium]